MSEAKINITIAPNKRERYERITIITLIILALGAIFLSWRVFSGAFEGQIEDQLLPSIIIFIVILIIVMTALIAFRLYQLWRAWRDREVGARMNGRLVFLFSMLAGLPALFIALFAYLFLEMGVNAWFSEQTRTALQESSEIADAYLEEHRGNITADALRIARDINNDINLQAGNLPLLQRVLDVHTRLRDVTEAAIFSSTSRQFVAKSGFYQLLEIDPLDQSYIDRANGGDVVLVDQGFQDRVRALVKLNLGDYMLYIGRLVDDKVIARVELTRGAVMAYENVANALPQIRLGFTLNFILICLILLMTGIWFSLYLANRIARPLGDLIGATKRISDGEFNVKLESPQGTGIEELRVLSQAFNVMSGELTQRRDDLIKVNDDLEKRRQFTEAVLASVGWGIIGLNPDQTINLANQGAEDLLPVNIKTHKGQALGALLPPLAPLLSRAKKIQSGRMIEEEIDLTINDEQRKFLVRIVSEGGLNDKSKQHQMDDVGFVVTFSDITPLLDAQRQAAWADVAKRIAHEIKNPLTPIQLSAERLARKYQGKIDKDDKVFENLINTIIRQVGDIESMVSAFSRFAHMPSPEFNKMDIVDLVRQAVFLRQSANQDIEFITDFSNDHIMIEGDEHQLSQLFNNLLKNAVEAIGAKTNDDKQAQNDKITLQLKHDDEFVTIMITDTGIGLPQNVEKRYLTDPYVTTRQKGTGLGLAIVAKIIEDHGGQLRLENRDDGQTGAKVSFSFKRNHTNLIK